ncbi:coiled-coil domain-containing protein 22 homolog [Centruroides sculpturatus]|uniref:coiled-coil domain-containing protein 22 homolog n=1 Tax=Centruroides sculpturatus TaxID=218467 RepID=UPI000C6E492B|nr:coiled-coil domain-containing protein 22 homolog [Centruroides sculpturatus]
MEEVDNIVIHTLRQIGCDIEDEVSSLKEFNTELVIEGVVRCLQQINSSLDLPRHVPPSMAARYRLGTALATNCTELGYNGEIGYQTFLYSNETELRRIFVFLIEKLPKESEKVSEEPIGKAALISRAIEAELSRLLKLPWLPNYCKTNGIRWNDHNLWHYEGYPNAMPFHTSKLIGPRENYFKLSKGLKQYYNKYVPLVTKQVPLPHQLVPSVFENNTLSVVYSLEWDNEWNQNGLPSRLTEQEYRKRKADRLQKRIAEQLRHSVQSAEAIIQEMSNFKALATSEKKNLRQKGSRFTHSEKLQFTQDEISNDQSKSIAPVVSSEEEVKKSQEEQISDLRNRVDELTETLEQKEIDAKHLNASIQQIAEQIISQEKKIEEFQEAYRVKKRTFDLLPDADNNLQKLQTMVEANGQKLVSLAGQWESHRAPLVEEYRQLKELSSQRLSETQRKLEEIKIIQEKVKEIKDDVHNKEELHKQLINEYERISKDVNRSSYTRRIIEIVGNIKKQKAEIDKVLCDTKVVQKEINQLAGKLDRTFTVTDELIFKDAKKDEGVRRAYKHLAALHENCSQLMQTVEETGAIMREIRDLEDQIEQESQKKVAANLERITADYKQMKQENETLMSQLKEH